MDRSCMLYLDCFGTKAMALMGLSMDPMWDLDLDYIYELGLIPWTPYELHRTLPAQGKARQIQTFICLLSRH